jgi:hypothetical protein
VILGKSILLSSIDINVFVALCIQDDRDPPLKLGKDLVRVFNANHNTP